MVTGQRLDMCVLEELLTALQAHAKLRRRRPWINLTASNDNRFNRCADASQPEAATCRTEPLGAFDGRLAGRCLQNRLIYASAIQDVDLARAPDPLGFSREVHNYEFT